MTDSGITPDTKISSCAGLGKTFKGGTVSFERVLYWPHWISEVGVNPRTPEAPISPYKWLIKSKS